MNNAKVSRYYTASPALEPMGLCGLAWAEKMGVSSKEVYNLLDTGDYYMTGYTEDGYDRHYIAGNEERGDTAHVILSTAILIEDGEFTRQTLTEGEASEWVRLKAPTNFCGHETVRLLGLEPDRSREQCNGYEQALCLSANERLEFGREYSLGEIEQIGVTFTLITKVESFDS